MHSPEYYMSLALAKLEEWVAAGYPPFACVLVDPTGNIAWQDHDRVDELMDPTAHAEVNTIRWICKTLGSRSLDGYSMYTTSEPCVTCLSACIKCHIGSVYYSADIESTASLPIRAVDIAKHALKYPIKVTGGILAGEGLKARMQVSN